MEWSLRAPQILAMAGGTDAESRTLADIDLCFRILGHSKAKALEEMLPEPAHSPKTGTKLAEKRWPSNLDIFPERMKAIGKPNIIVDDHGTGAQLLEGRSR
jgi:hypothetical protein